MRKNKDKSPIVTKIEMDEQTAEPVLVEVKEENLPDFTEPERTPEPPSAPKNSVGEQMVMPIYGFTTKSDEEVSKRQKLFKRLITVVFVVFIVGVLAYTAYQDFFSGETVSWAEVGQTLSANWYYILFALASLGLCFLLKGTKLSITCKAMTGKWHFKTCLETGIIGHYYNNVTPLAVGGQPFEIYHLSKHGVHGGVASSLPIATFFLNQFAFVILGAVALILLQFNTLGLPVEVTSMGFQSVVGIAAIVGLLSCLFVPLMVVVFSCIPRVGAKLVKWVMAIGAKLKIVKKPKETTYRTIKNVVHNSKCLKKLATNPLVFFMTFFLSLCEQFALSSIAFFTLKFFGLHWTDNFMLEWLQVVQLCLIIYAAVSFVPTPGNSGAADFSFYSLFAAGVAGGLVFPSMMIWRFISYYSFIVIGFIFLTVKKRQELAQKRREEKEQGFTQN